MPSVLEVDVPTPPSSAGAAQVSQSWLPKAGSTLQPDPMCTNLELWVEFMLRELCCDERTVVIGHSAGTAST